MQPPGFTLWIYAALTTGDLLHVAPRPSDAAFIYFLSQLFLLFHLTPSFILLFLPRAICFVVCELSLKLPKKTLNT